jgi:hypothetical protein
MEKLFALFCVFVSSVLPSASGKEPISQEERIVRETYAKLIFGTMITGVHNILAADRNATSTDFETELSKHKLQFELSDFVVGSVDELAERQYEELVTRPNGEEILDVTTNHFHMTDRLKDLKEIRQTEELGASVVWGKAQILTESWKIPFRQLLPILDSQNDAHYSRYASFMVSAAFEGRSRHYIALFLFGTGKVPVLPIDTVTNNSALAHFVSGSIYPSILIDSSVIQKPGIIKWLRLHQLTEQTCESGKRTACCDPASLTCGISSGDVDRALKRSFSSVPREIAPGVLAVGPSSVHLINVNGMVFD